jgi:hypothetical protein
MLEIGVISALTMALVEIGKRKIPSWFTSDVNVLWSVVVMTSLNVANAMYFGGDVKLAASAGVVNGLALSGAYRLVSGLAKRNSLDFSEQASELVVGHPAELREAMKAKDDEEETVVRGFTGK